MSVLSYGPILLLAIFGLIFAWKSHRKYVLLFGLLFLSFTIGYAFFITKARFRLPLDPYLIILGSYGAWSIAHGAWRKELSAQSIMSNA